MSSADDKEDLVKKNIEPKVKCSFSLKVCVCAITVTALKNMEGAVK
jgi:hypothetical protein